MIREQGNEPHQQCGKPQDDGFVGLALQGLFHHILDLALGIGDHSGRTAKEIAHRLGKNEKSIQNAIYRIRRKLRTEIPNPSDMPK